MPTKRRKKQPPVLVVHAANEGDQWLATASFGNRFSEAWAPTEREAIWSAVETVLQE